MLRAEDIRQIGADRIREHMSYESEEFIKRVSDMMRGSEADGSIQMEVGDFEEFEELGLITDAIKLLKLLGFTVSVMDCTSGDRTLWMVDISWIMKTRGF